MWRTWVILVLGLVVVISSCGGEHRVPAPVATATIRVEEATATSTVAPTATATPTHRASFAVWTCVSGRCTASLNSPS